MTADVRALSDHSLVADLKTAAGHEREATTRVIALLAEFDARRLYLLRRAQDLLRHAIPGGDPAAIVDRALTLLIEHLAKTRLGATSRPGPVRAGARSRHIPRAVRRAVVARDNGQCAFAGAEGRCTERGFLEVHHVVPYVDGGEATVDGIELRCRAHNQYEAVLWDGGGGWTRG